MDLPAGYTPRHATLDDVAAICALVQAVDVEEYGAPDYDESDVADNFALEGLDPVRDTWIVESPDGAVVGHAGLWDKDPGRLTAAECSVHPDAPDLYPWLVERITERAARHGDVTVHVSGAPTNLRRAAALEAAGYASVRVYQVMERPLDDLPPPPANVRQADDIRAVYDVQQASFADHHDFAPATYDAWRRMFVDTERHMPEHWWVADLDGEPAGMLIGTVHDGVQGWVRSIGVLDRARGRGIGTALLLRAFHGFRDAGLATVALSVDTENVTGALGLYERLGMTATKRYDVYERVLTRR